jgi:hypothetical protein
MPRGVVADVVGPADQGFLPVAVSHHQPPKTFPGPAKEPMTSSGGEETSMRRKEYIQIWGRWAPEHPPRPSRHPTLPCQPRG